MVKKNNYYCLFLDESGTPELKNIDKTYPIFTLAGVLIEEDYYKEYCIDRGVKFKTDLFGNADIILKSYYIRKK